MQNRLIFCEFEYSFFSCYESEFMIDFSVKFEKYHEFCLWMPNILLPQLQSLYLFVGKCSENMRKIDLSALCSNHNDP